MTARSLVRLSGAAVLSAALAACASGGRSLDVAGESADYKGAVDAYTNPAVDTTGMDPIAAAAFWGAQYDRDPNAWRTAVSYSEALRKIGSVEQSVNVMMRAVERHSTTPEVNLEAGKALIEGGRAFEAVRYLEEAEAARPNDWRTLSVYGVALDQIGEHGVARTKYEKALNYAPGEVSLLNNKGLSYAMSGDLGEAVRILRTAAATRGADARVRQNLALALALKGEMFEAERLARSDLPPQVADKNIDYFRSLMAQPAYWGAIAADNVETPTFAPIAAPKKTAEPAPELLTPEILAPEPAAPAAEAAAQPAPKPATIAEPTALTVDPQTDDQPAGASIK